MSKFERKFGKYAINNLMYYLILLYVVGCIIMLTRPEIYIRYLSLDFNQVFSGQVWRLITFLMYPISNSILFMIIMLFVYYSIGRVVENAIGSFRFNIFIFGGIISLWIVGLVYYLINKPFSVMLGGSYLNLSLMIILILINPEQEFLFYFVIPLKAKWFAIIIGLNFIVSIINPGPSRYEAIAALINLLIMYFVMKKQNRVYVKKDAEIFTKRQKKFEKELSNLPKHKCCICGITEKDDPNMEFRYCSKCSGLKEYCINHINDHEHN